MGVLSGHVLNFQGNECTDRVVINVGGTKHECYISTIQNFPDTRLYWIAETALKMADFDARTNEFFFDRHPGCFQNIMNYCRTGKLHCPNDVCGPLFEQELAFWGVDELMMEPCCWGNYTQHRDAHKNLKMFDSMFGECEDDDEECEYTPSRRNFMWRILANGRPKIWATLEKPFSSPYAQLVAVISMLVIIFSIATFCLQTMPQLHSYKPKFDKLEYFYCGFFTLEFVIRLVCCPSFKAFFTSSLTYIDLISTLQFYIAFFVKTSSLDFLFVSRLIRIFRLFRFFKQLSGMQVIAQTLKASMNELMLLSLLVMIPMIIFSTLIYYAEKSAEVNFKSIPEYFWWAIVTMTTVGYGDMVPHSGYAKIIGSMCACSGVLIVALPVSVIGSNFTLYYSYAQARMKLPKRQSPALVTADKNLINRKQSEIAKTKRKQGDGMMSKGLQGLATVMIDLAIPSRERRDAIQPYDDIIQYQDTVDSHNNSQNSLEPPSNVRDPSEEKKQLLGIHNSFNSRISSLPSIRSINPLTSAENLCIHKDPTSCDDLPMRVLSMSDNGDMLMSSDRSPKGVNVFHVDFAKYIPRRLSLAQVKERRTWKEIKQIHNRLSNNSKSTMGSSIFPAMRRKLSALRKTKQSDTDLQCVTNNNNRLLQNVNVYVSSSSPPSLPRSTTGHKVNNEDL